MWNHISLIRIIKENIPFPIKILLIRLLFFLQSFYYNLFPKKVCKSSNNTIYFLLSTDYSNLGDHAMSYASILMLKKLYPEYTISEVTVNDTLKSLKDIMKSIKSKDIVCLKGGGNIGVQYFREELLRRKIIRVLNGTSIIIFPQTAYFPNSKFGRRELNNTLKIYKAHDKLTIMLRDEYSYKIFFGSLKNVYLTTDIAFSLTNISTGNHKKYKYSICLRSDVEGIYDINFKQNLNSNLKERYSEISSFDTIKPYYISKSDREMELMKIWTNIEESKILITDRLHGMIFAYLLKTPCVVLKTYNHKLIGQYQWLKSSRSFAFYDQNKDDMYELIDSLVGTNDFHIEEIDEKVERIEKIVRGVGS